MRIGAFAFAWIILVIAMTGCGGNEGDGSSPPDSLPSDETAADTLTSSDDGTLREAAEDILETPRASSGAMNLIDEAHSAADQANQRTQELQEMMGDM